jgi:hypothetical protein
MGEMAMTTKRKLKSDSKTARCPGQDDELKRGMPQPGGPELHRGKAKTRAKTRAGKQALQVEASKEKFDLKDQLNLKEQRFIELYLTGDLTVDKAMESVGYVGYHKKSLYRLGRKIVEKYEWSTGDHRKIFRAIGAGEVAIAQGLLNLAQNAKSEMVRLNAWATIAKCPEAPAAPPGTLQITR